MSGFALDGRPLLRPGENPADGIHLLIPREVNPYGPSVEFSGGHPVRAIRQAPYPVTRASIERALAALGWRVLCGRWVVGLSPSAITQEALLLEVEALPTPPPGTAA